MPSLALKVRWPVHVERLKIPAVPVLTSANPLLNSRAVRKRRKVTVTLFETQTREMGTDWSCSKRATSGE